MALIFAALLLPLAVGARGSEPLAEVEGQAITAAQVDRALGVQLQRLEEQLDALRRQKLAALIAERLLALEAARRGLSVRALLDAEVASKVEPVAEQEIKVEDFHCQFCRRAQATLAQLQARYGDKVKLIHRDFPIDSLHPQARRAHEAARCAHNQGKFWAYHGVLYALGHVPLPRRAVRPAAQASVERRQVEADLSGVGPEVLRARLRRLRVAST